MAELHLTPAQIKIRMENRIKSAAIVVNQCCEWYLLHSGGKGPEEIREHNEDGNRILRFLEPPIPGVDNPLIIEEMVGNFWTIRVECRETFRR